MVDLIMPRRKFLTGLMGLVAAPAVVKAASLMPVKVIELPPPPIGFRRLTLADYRKMVEPNLRQIFDVMYEDRSEQWDNVFKSVEQ